MPQLRFVHLGGPISPFGRLFFFLMVLLVFAVVIAFALLALGLFLIFAPVLIAVAFALYFFRRIFGPRRPRTDATRDGIIEGEFRVIDPDAPRISPSRDPHREP